jgi:hypothetical protein
LTCIKCGWINLGDSVGWKNICALAFTMPPLGSHVDRTKAVYPRPRLADVKKRFAERDQRQATDTRSPAQRWLGDPPPERSALAQLRSRSPDMRASISLPVDRPSRSERRKPISRFG